MLEETAKERSREELLKTLHSISYWAFITDLVTEMCYEVTEYTSKGTSYSWIAYNEWNFFKLENIGGGDWAAIRNKLANKELDFEDIAETDIEKLVSYIEDEGGRNANDLSVLLGNLLGLPEIIDGPIYCYYDTTCHFALSEAEVREIAGNLICCSTRWEELSIEQLEECVELYEEYGPDIPLVFFDEDEE